MVDDLSFFKGQQNQWLYIGYWQLLKEKSNHKLYKKDKQKNSIEHFQRLSVQYFFIENSVDKTRRKDEAPNKI